MPGRRRRRCVANWSAKSSVDHWGPLNVRQPGTEAGREAHGWWITMATHPGLVSPSELAHVNRTTANAFPFHFCRLNVNHSSSSVITWPHWDKWWRHRILSLSSQPVTGGAQQLARLLPGRAPFNVNLWGLLWDNCRSLFHR